MQDAPRETLICVECLTLLGPGRFQLMRFFLCSLELTGAGVSALFDEHPFAKVLKTLAQLDVPFFCHPHQSSSGLVVKPGISGNATAFSWTVVSTLTRSTCLSVNSWPRLAVSRVSVSNFSNLSGPRRLRQRTNEEGSSGNSC